MTSVVIQKQTTRKVEKYIEILIFRYTPDSSFNSLHWLKIDPTNSLHIPVTISTAKKPLDPKKKTEKTYGGQILMPWITKFKQAKKRNDGNRTLSPPHSPTNPPSFLAGFMKTKGLK